MRPLSRSKITNQQQQQQNDGSSGCVGVNQSGTPLARHGLSATNSTQHPGSPQPTRLAWTELDMGGMGLRALAPELLRYTFLTRLYINHKLNSRFWLPRDISRLSNLVELDASGNQLTRIPGEIGLCCKLKDLRL